VPDSNVTITNCILWDQNGEIWIDDDSTVAVTYSDIQGGWYTGEGNVDTDPLFMNQAGGNYHLRPNSPCINAGNNSAVPSGVTTDLDSKPRIINGTVDMGAYEYEQQQLRIIYVDAGTSGENNGSSWTDAYNFLQDALADANASETRTEIRVAAGTYQPDWGVGQIRSDRTATFQLLNGVAIKGGYAGFGTPHPDARDIEVYETILSGDLAGNDAEIYDPEQLGWEPTRSENAYHVVTGTQTNETAVIDGFTVTAGNANYDDFSLCNGPGMFNDHGSPTILNCTFIANFAGNNDGGGAGGAMFNLASHPTITNCRFVRNAAIALDGGEGSAGAVFNENSNPRIADCTFIGNVAGHDGGAMYNSSSNPTLTNCEFIGNLAREGGSGSYGGAVWNYWSNPVLTNCLFTGNKAGSSQVGSGGGAIWAAYGSVTIINCTFNGNVAEQGGAIYGDYEASFSLANCILWNDRPDEIHTRGTPPVMKYCDVQNGSLGEGNITADPCFAAPGHWDDDDPWVNGDYHLKSFGWRWDPARAQWTFDRVTSRCIDAGNPGSPLGAELLFVPEDPNNEWGENLRINMGAYGGTAQASIPPYDWALLADLNNDGAVDWLDFVCTGCDWLKTAPYQPCDLNRNGDVNPADLDLFADDWLKTTIWRK
jgi:predicted outer membrane repeat protein